MDEFPGDRPLRPACRGPTSSFGFRGAQLEDRTLLSWRVSSGHVSELGEHHDDVFGSDEFWS
ncbi:MAG: hypothetical protein NVSMB17_19920 [Candidatus Dormibacteria bacterium]